MKTHYAEIASLYVAHHKTLVKVIARMVGCYQTAEDLAQEAYIKVSCASQNQVIRYPQPFLYQTAKNLALDHLRKQKVRGNQQGDLAEAEAYPQIADHAPTPDRVAEAGQELEEILKVLAKLPERRRKMLILHRVHGWKYAQIAAHFGVSKSAVEKNIRIALTHCLAANASPPK